MIDEEDEVVIAPAPLLCVSGLVVAYGRALALREVSLDVRRGSMTAILGANGAGKSTLARAVSGLIPSAAGRIMFAGEDITRWPPYRIRRAGLIHVPESRGIFPGLSVQDNLRMAVGPLKRGEQAAAIDRAIELFPALGGRKRQLAGSLSGGEQQMLSLARALIVQPQLIVGDELSLGLAPRLVDLVFETLVQARTMGITVLLIEQYVERALSIADECFILQRGNVAWHGAASEAAAEAATHYLGVSTHATSNDDRPLESRTAR
jgi:branched-chain amino acid transport system ATP-binding protein